MWPGSRKNSVRASFFSLPLIQSWNAHRSMMMMMARLFCAGPPAVYEHNEESFSHIDFLWATNAYRQIYPPILQLIQKYNRG